MAWGANFNFSIWFIELRGIMNTDIVSRAQIEYEKVRLHPHPTILTGIASVGPKGYTIFTSVRKCKPSACVSSTLESAI
jgi:hypothetical protein